MKKTLSFIKILSLLTALILCFTACSTSLPDSEGLGFYIPGFEENEEGGKNPSGTPESGKTDEGGELLKYEVRNGNKPYFTESEITSVAFESYSPLDPLGRCGVATACIGKETMPKNGEQREDIGSVKPSGWYQASYDFVPGKYLYHRSHLIGWQLSAENANTQNLITGTEFMNTDGMLPFENQVAAYVKLGNHVMYRVTPDFQGNNLVASGVLIEAYSVEDNGKGISFCVYVFNHQPGVSIDYATGKSRLDTAGGGTGDSDGGSAVIPEAQNYVINTNPNSMKFHKDTCTHASKISSSNRQDYYGFREDLIEEGYIPCAVCNP